jgi:hypothetical protein
MTRGGLAGIAIVLIALSPVVQAAQKPALSGTWIVAPPAKGAGREIVVTQNDQTLTIAVAGRKMVYQLDGVERRRVMPSRVGEIVMVTKAAVAGKTIVVSIATDYPNKMKTLEKEVWSIDDRGRLVRDTVTTAEGNAPIVEKTLHTRKN